MIQISEWLLLNLQSEWLKHVKILENDRDRINNSNGVDSR